MSSNRSDSIIQLPNYYEFYITFKVDLNEIYYVNIHEQPVEHELIDWDVNVTSDKMKDVLNSPFFKSSTTVKSYNIPTVSNPTTVPLDNTGERLLPSYLAYDEKNYICGRVAVNRLRNFSKSVIFDSKRIIGRRINEIEIDSNWPFNISSKNDKVVMEIKKLNVTVEISAEEAATDLLKYMKKKAEEFQAKKLVKVVITVPAAFNEKQKDATIQAAKSAGWNEIILLPEPIAAAFAYFIDRPISNNSNVLLFDLGGGTLDVCIFNITDGKIQIISNNGDSKLGGRDFDTVLFNYFKNKLASKFGIALIKDKKYKLLFHCQQIKEDLSTIENC
uniref:Heat shock protein 70 n=1 Tax=Panagrolaimus sp. ES5 TaxID=591445 RepID=A0AC34G6M4_9BILA